MTLEKTLMTGCSLSTEELALSADVLHIRLLPLWENLTFTMIKRILWVKTAIRAQKKFFGCWSRSINSRESAEQLVRFTAPLTGIDTLIVFEEVQIWV